MITNSSLPESQSDVDIATLQRVASRLVINQYGQSTENRDETLFYCRCRGRYYVLVVSSYDDEMRTSEWLDWIVDPARHGWIIET